MCPTAAARLSKRQQTSNACSTRSGILKSRVSSTTGLSNGPSTAPGQAGEADSLKDWWDSPHQLTKTLGRSLITFEELRTIIKELAGVINDRPISYVESAVDSPLPLTPSQFIRGGPPVPLPASIHTLDRLGPNGSVAVDELREILTNRTNYFKSLSSRWRREYILQLRSAQRSRGTQSNPMPDGEVCL